MLELDIQIIGFITKPRNIINLPLEHRRCLMWYFWDLILSTKTKTYLRILGMNYSLILKITRKNKCQRQGDKTQQV